MLRGIHARADENNMADFFLPFSHHFFATFSRTKRRILSVYRTIWKRNLYFFFQLFAY